MMLNEMSTLLTEQCGGISRDDEVNPNLALRCDEIIWKAERVQASNFRVRPAGLTQEIFRKSRVSGLRERTRDFGEIYKSQTSFA